VRAEIEQLNGQIFAVLSTALTVDITILGWFFTRNDPSSYFVIPTIGIILLFFGSVLLLNRNRLAHRLALFQKYFIEPRAPDICWGRVYFKYRIEYEKQDQGIPKISTISERLADSAVYVLLFAAGINLVVLIGFGVGPYVPHQRVQFTWRLVNLAVAITFFCLPLWLRRVMSDYSAIEATMQKIARQSGLKSATNNCSVVIAPAPTSRDRLQSGV